MSYARDQRRKKIKELKNKFGDSGFNADRWKIEYRQFVEKIEAERRGPCIGTLEDIMNAQRTSRAILSGLASTT